MKRLEREQANMVLAAKLAHIKLSLAGPIRPFKHYDLATEFNKQFDEIRSRYKFLVIEGRSKTGNTYFTKWMLGSTGRVFERTVPHVPNQNSGTLKPSTITLSSSTKLHLRW